MVEPKETFLTIGELAKAAGVNLQTIRYYERIELFPKPRTKESGYRQYSELDLSRLLSVKKAKELGFSLKEIAELLALKVDNGKTCTDIRKMAEKSIVTIHDKIQTLMKFADALQRLSKQCHGSGPTGECPILEIFEPKYI